MIEDDIARLGSGLRIAGGQGAPQCANFLEASVVVGLVGDVALLEGGQKLLCGGVVFQRDGERLVVNGNPELQKVLSSA